MCAHKLTNTYQKKKIKNFFTFIPSTIKRIKIYFTFLSIVVNGLFIFKRLYVCCVCYVWWWWCTYTHNNDAAQGNLLSKRWRASALCLVFLSSSFFFLLKRRKYVRKEMNKMLARAWESVLYAKPVKKKYKQKIKEIFNFHIRSVWSGFFFFLVCFF